MKLGSRIRETLARAGLTPRHLGGVTAIHFVSIYRIMNNPDTDTPPLHKNTLNDALRRIDVLCEDGRLPFTGKLSRKEKTDRLKDLLAQTK